MKLITITTLQEPNKSQYSVLFGELPKRWMKALGWTKGTRLAIYRQGAGFFISKADLVQEEEIKLGEKDESGKSQDKTD